MMFWQIKIFQIYFCMLTAMSRQKNMNIEENETQQPQQPKEIPENSKIMFC